MSGSVSRMLNQPVWAVVGATQNTNKFGYRIWQRLKSAGYEVYPVNPVYSEIEGEPCYPSLSALPVIPKCINMVVAPDKAPVFIEEAAALGIPMIWFQPGAFEDDTLALANSRGLEVVSHYCVLVELGKIGK